MTYSIIKAIANLPSENDILDLILNTSNPDRNKKLVALCYLGLRSSDIIEEQYQVSNDKIIYRDCHCDIPQSLRHIVTDNIKVNSRQRSRQNTLTRLSNTQLYRITKNITGLSPEQIRALSPFVWKNTVTNLPSKYANSYTEKRNKIRNTQKEVYLFYCEELHLFKIGMSRCLEKRLAQANTFCPFDVVCLYRIPFTGEATEYSIHHRFKSLKLINKKEWFYYDDSILEYFKLMSLSATTTIVI
jgi:hypothetical protein